MMKQVMLALIALCVLSLPSSADENLQRHRKVTQLGDENTEDRVALLSSLWETDGIKNRGLRALPPDGDMSMSMPLIPKSKGMMGMAKSKAKSPTKEHKDKDMPKGMKAPKDKDMSPKTKAPKAPKDKDDMPPTSSKPKAPKDKDMPPKSSKPKDTYSKSAKTVKGGDKASKVKSKAKDVEKKSMKNTKSMKMDLDSSMSYFYF